MGLLNIIGDYWGLVFSSPRDDPPAMAEPWPPQLTDIIGTCADCRYDVLRRDEAWEENELLHHRCVEKRYGGRGNEAKMRRVWRTLGRPFYLAFGESITPSLETLLVKGVDTQTAHAYLDSLDAKLRRTPCMESSKRTNAMNALRAARLLLD